MLPAIVHIKLKVIYRLPPYLSIIFNRPVRMRNHTLKVAIILGSTRPGRNGEVVSQWIYQIAKKRSDANFELIDIKDYNLPLLDEPIPPSLGQYTKEHTKTKSLKIDSFDAYIFVTAEYNHGIPGYTKLLYNQRNKDETIISVIKRLFGEYITSRLVRTQNRELSFRCIAYNMHRLTNLIFIVMVST